MHLTHSGLECPQLPGSVADAIKMAAPDVVINVTGYTAVDDAEDEPERAFRVNADAAGEAAAAAKEAGAHFSRFPPTMCSTGRLTALTARTR